MFWKKKAATTTKTPKKKFPKGYFVGTLLLASILIFGVYQNSEGPLARAVQNFISHKPELLDQLGDITTVTGLPTVASPNLNNVYPVGVSIFGSKGKGTLTGNLKYSGNQWVLKNPALVTDAGKTDMSSFFVATQTYHSPSSSSTPLESPLVKAGYDVYIKTRLGGVVPHEKGTHITQSLKLYDANSKLLRTAKNISVFETSANKKVPSEGVGFTTRLANLLPGTYGVEMIFRDEMTNQIIAKKQNLVVKAPHNELAVKSVQFFRDKDRTDKVLDTAFSSTDRIYLRLALDGFLVNDNSVAGTVALKIENGKGETIAYQPKFATFNEPVEPNKKVVVDGELKLNEPDVYFLSFRVNDDFGRQNIIHDEKILVRLDAPKETDPTKEADSFKETDF